MFRFACLVLVLALSAALSPSARAEGPLAIVEGLPEDPVFDVARRAAESDAPAPTSRFAARRNARRAAQNVTLALHSEGFYAARAEPFVEDGAPPVARVQVSVGERFVFGEVTLVLSETLEENAETAAQAAVGLRPGAPARSQDILDAQARVVAALLAAGRPDAAAGERTLRVDYDRAIMDVTLRFDTGALARLGAPEASGGARVRDRLLLRLAPYEAGDVYSPALLRDYAARLRETEAFSSVAVGLGDAGPDGLRPVRVTLEDEPRRTLTLGGSFATEDGGGLEGRWTLRNAFASAEELSVEARALTLERALFAQLSIPAWRRPQRDLRFGAGLLQEDTDAFDRLAASFQVEASQPLSERVSAALGLGVTVQETRDVLTTQRLALFRGAASVSFDNADDPLNPTEGLRARVTLRPITGVGDDAIAYLISDIEGSAYRSLRSERLVAAARLRAASLTASATDAVPADDLFFAGGGGSIRGYPFQAVSPRDADGVLAGGASLVETALELRARFSDRFGGVAFVDGGAASEGETPDLGDVRWGAGVGVRYFTDFGPLRADIAAPLDPFDGDPRVQIYLSIGQSF